MDISRLRAERLQRGWSLTKLTIKTGITTTSLSMVERGLLPAYPGWQRRIAEAFGLPIEELFPPNAAARTKPAA